MAAGCRTGVALGTECLAAARNEVERASNAALVGNKNSSVGTDSSDCEQVAREWRRLRER